MKPHKIYADYVDPKALDQFYTVMKHPAIIKGALMPDVHAGYTLPIGGVVLAYNMVFPAFTGFDIGCGVCAIATTFKKQDIQNYAQDIFQSIYENVPVGFQHSQKQAKWDYEKYPMTSVTKAIFEKNGLNQLGTLGGGNHFIEIGYDEQDKIYVIIHSGSRNVGHTVATHYMKLASGTGKAKEGCYGFTMDSQEGKDYMMDQMFCLEFALENRVQILEKAEKAIQEFVQGKMVWDSLINRTHNHALVTQDGIIHRKGATHAEAGMFGVIPGNMRDGSFIVRGKGNPDSLWSSSHGAGRVLGRKAANEAVDIDEFISEMKGITAKVDKDTLDESPMAYKNIFDVMDQQFDLVEVVKHIKPLINVKG